MNEVVTWAALVAAVTAMGWIARIAYRFAQAEGVAKEARTAAEEAKEEATGMQTQITAMNAAFGLYRETLAREAHNFVTRDMLRELEQRIDTAVRDSADRTAKGISELGERIDKFVLAFTDHAPARPGRR